MDVISSNMANVDTTRGKRIDGQWQPYTRKMVVMQPIVHLLLPLYKELLNNNEMGGVKVTNIVEDDTPYRMVYDPDHPEANEEGYVQLPNVDPLREMVRLD